MSISARMIKQRESLRATNVTNTTYVERTAIVPQTTQAAAPWIKLNSTRCMHTRELLEWVRMNSPTAAMLAITQAHRAVNFMLKY